MTVFCTYCSAHKVPTLTPIPAIKRYRSARIDVVAAQAAANAYPLYIVSGKFGLLAAEAPVPYYDYLLTADSAPQHAQLVAQQLAAIGIEQLIFFARPEEHDPGAQPYVACVQLACTTAGVAFELRYEEFSA